ncbi:MAG: tRNA (adenosine(37)-N6)-threonylcarbamoyltransferase complex dimerization subunit type 1 TsaB [Cyanobium sp.]
MSGPTSPPSGPLPPPSGPRPWLLALHSSGESLGVALQRLGVEEEPHLAAFPLGRALSGALFGCVEAVLPAEQWRSLGRLAVATGPGGFTGTRLTVAMARTLAQQLALPLDGIGSFALTARRLRRQGLVEARPFWVVQTLPRRGLVAGLYGPEPGPAAGRDGTAGPLLDQGGALLELSAPRLYREPSALAEAEAQLLATAEDSPAPRCPADVLQPDDVAELLRCSQEAAAAGRSAPWAPVLPIYPTSPVDGSG